MPNSRATQSRYKLRLENTSELTSQTSINYMSTGSMLCSLLLILKLRTVW